MRNLLIPLGGIPEFPFGGEALNVVLIASFSESPLTG
jgi:hypothetical protein